MLHERPKPMESQDVDDVDRHAEPEWFPVPAWLERLAPGGGDADELTEWREDLHPRADDGRFGEKPGEHHHADAGTSTVLDRMAAKSFEHRFAHARRSNPMAFATPLHREGERSAEKRSWMESLKDAEASDAQAPIKPYDYAKGYVDSLPIREVARSFRAAPVAVQVRDGTLPRVLASGRVLSVHESESRRKKDDGYMAYRVDAEREMFGDITTDVVYGHLAADFMDRNTGGASQYGYHRLVLKSHVRERSTFTYGDSFDDDSRWAMDSGAAGVELMIARANARGRVPAYVEAQIHGGVGLMDIDHIETSHIEGARAALSSAGIKVEEHSDGTTTVMGIPLRAVNYDYNRSKRWAEANKARGGS